MEKQQERNSKVSQVLIIGAAVGVGIMLGRRYQMRLHAESLRGARVFTKVANPLFPDTMPISEIKKVLSSTNTPFSDAIVTIIDDVTTIIIREVVE